MKSRPDHKPSIRRTVRRDWLGLALLVLAVSVGIFLERTWSEAETLRSSQAWLPVEPVEFDESILAEPNPFAADIRALTQLIQERFSYLEHRRKLDGLDIERLEAAALAELRADDDELTFQRAVKRYVAGLHDGHAFVSFAENRLPSNRHWPFTALLVAEGVMVDGVHPDVAEILQRGDLVLSVNGQDIGGCLAEVALEIYASTDLARKRKALKWISHWSRTEELELRLEGLDGSVREVSVPCPLHLPMKVARPGVLPSEREARWLPGRIAYFRPGNFAPPADSGFSELSRAERDEVLSGSYDKVHRTFLDFAMARAWILDLRGNPGGTDLLGRALVSHLVEVDQTYYRLGSLWRSGWKLMPPILIGEEAIGEEEPDGAFHGKLICLIDAGTFSVADNVAACLDDLHPTITFVGENTGGGTGAPRSFILPRTKTRVTFCTMRVYSPDGELIEGVGVAPDLPVLRTRADVLAGRDTVLEAALRQLEE